MGGGGVDSAAGADVLLGGDEGGVAEAFAEDFGVDAVAGQPGGVGVA